MSHDLVLVEKIDHAAVLSLNNPPLNSLSGQVIEALDRGISEMLAGESLSFGDAMKKESALFGRLCATRDKQEGVRAFLEKRKPKFEGS